MIRPDIYEIAEGAERFLHSVGGTPELFTQRFGEKATEEYAHTLASVIQTRMILARQRKLQEN